MTGPSDNEPRLLFEIDGVKAFIFQDGNESEINPTPGGHTLSLVLVPTPVTVPVPSPTGYGTVTSVEETDYYLHIQMPGLDLSLPATTPIFSMPPRSYVIPLMGDIEGVFHKFEFQPKVSADLIDTFESILNQFTSFSMPPEPTSAVEKPVNKSKKATEASRSSIVAPPPPYNPADYEPGEGYVKGTATGMENHGRLVLVDEENGSIVGELAENVTITEDKKLKQGSKAPVEITIDEANKINVAPISEDYLDMARHPVYNKSSVVQTSAMASRFIVMAADQLSRMIASGAEGVMHRTKAADAPLTFKPSTHASARQIGSLTSGAANLSARTVGQATKVAQNIGASLSSRDKEKGKGKGKKGTEAEGGVVRSGGRGTGKVGYDEHGNPVVQDSGYTPGLLNKSLIAFSTVMDGVAYGGTRVLKTGAESVTQMVAKKWGAEAGAIANEVVGGVKNVGLVYIDITGVSRRAVIKSVAKGMVIGRVKDGSAVIVRPGDGVADKAASSPALAGAGVAGAAGATGASGRPPLNRPASSATLTTAAGATGARESRTTPLQMPRPPSQTPSRSQTPLPPPPPYPAK